MSSGKPGVVILDTNALVFDALDPARLTGRARRLIERAHTRRDLYCCDISLWEIAMLVAKRRLDPGVGALEFLRLAVAARALTVLPITPEIADLSVAMPDAVGADPADRLIAATAIHHRATLVTTDTRLKKAALPVPVVG